MKRITVFCGSSAGNEKKFLEHATAAGKALAENKIGLVYGGAKVGIMGAVADAVLANDGEAIGVLPRFLQTKEVAHDNLTELILVDTMHERKMKMNELCDGVIALPGGFGTLEELFEMLTWSQLGLHKKPVGLLNVDGFYDPLVAMLEKMRGAGFLKEEHFKILLVEREIGPLLQKMKHYAAPSTGKWISRETT